MGCLSCAAIVIVVFLVLLRLYHKLTTKWCKSKTCLAGETVIVTGANTGIGYEAALDLACRGAKVILACRDQRRADEARFKIIKESGNANVIVKIVDLASYDSVRAFSKDINETEERLDILINNAGIIGIGDVRSKDGHNLLMQINYYSSFLLTHLLIDLLKKSGPSRIINVSSRGAARARKFDVDKLDTFPGNFSTLYANSKLCNILFTRELAKRLRGSLVTTYSLHPGFVATEIFKNFEGYIKILVDALVLCYSKTPIEGAQTTIYTAVAKEVENLNGELFAECARIEPYKSVITSYQKKLWEKTIDLIKMKPEEIKI